ncbi:MAG: apolipoprotein N-acyltransferase [Candidatus Eisenbacteria bacterium]|nr:apolipoprotein N-acyltransferase [Candidatus Eisenbacteria bacterium]
MANGLVGGPPRGWSRTLAALASGVLLAASFPPLDLSWLVFVALVPLCWAVFGTARPDEGEVGTPKPFRPFRLAYLTAFVFYVLHLDWLLNLSKEEVTIPWIMYPALAAVSLYFGLFMAGPVWATAKLTSGSGAAHIGQGDDRSSASDKSQSGRTVRSRLQLPVFLVLPVFWALFDWLRTTGELAFSWGSLGYALAPIPAALQGTPWFGYWILPGWIVLVNGLVWQGIRGDRRWLGVAAALVLLPCAAGEWIVARAPETVWLARSETTTTIDPEEPLAPIVLPEPDKGWTKSKPAGTVRFGIVQANTPREVKWNEDYREIVVRDLVSKTYEIAHDARPDLILWPETAAPLLVMWYASLRREVMTCVRDIQTWTLVGTLDAKRVGEDTEQYNSAILFGPDGSDVFRYNKRKMVPFGELTPWRDSFPLLAKADFGQSEFTPGKTTGLVTIPDVGTVTCLICFESTFPELSRRDVKDGAKFLVNITNDFWFGAGSGPIQHQQFAILRAVENRTPLVRCANTGISCVIDPYGRVQYPTELFTAVLHTCDVLPGEGGSLYVQWGSWILYVYAGCAGVFVILALLRRRRSDGTAVSSAPR